MKSKTNNQTTNKVDNLVNNIGETLYNSMNLEGTTKAPRKFTVGEIFERVNSAFLLAPNEEMEEKVKEIVLTKLRESGKIKKEMSNYNLAQEIIAYRVLNPKTDNSLLPSLCNSRKFTIEITEEEQTELRKLVNLRNGNGVHTIQKGFNEESVCSYSANFGEIKEKDVTEKVVKS